MKFGPEADHRFQGPMTRIAAATVGIIMEICDEGVLKGIRTSSFDSLTNLIQQSNPVAARRLYKAYVVE
jgi:hypothetical protein